MSKIIYSSNKRKIDFTDFIQNFDADEKNNANCKDCFINVNFSDKNLNYFTKKNRNSRYIDKKYIIQYNKNNDNTINSNYDTETQNYINYGIKNDCINSGNKYNMNIKEDRIKLENANIINFYSKKDTYTFPYQRIDRNNYDNNNNENIHYQINDYKSIPQTIEENAKDNRHLADIKFANQTLYKVWGNDNNVRDYSQVNRDPSNICCLKNNDAHGYNTQFQDNNNLKNKTKDQNKFINTKTKSVDPLSPNKDISKQNEILLNMNPQIPNEIIGSLSFEEFIKKSQSMSSINDREMERNRNNIMKEINHKTNIDLKSIPNPKINTKSKIQNEGTNPEREYTYSNESQNRVGMYLDRRHREEKERINQIRTERINQENKNIKDKPTISKNSKKLLDQKSNDKSVFKRLTDNNQFLKKEEDLKLLDEIYNQSPCTFEPEINQISKLQKRDVNDLYNWMMRKETKRLEREIKTNIKKNTKILPNSEEILKEINPNYLEKRVEDRLIEKGNLTKVKVEKMKENHFKEITGCINKRSYANHKINSNEGKYKGANNANNIRIGDNIALDRKNNFKSESKHVSLRNITNQIERNLKRPKSAGLINHNFEMKRNDKSNLETEKDIEKESALEIRKNLHSYLNKFGKNNKNEKQSSPIDDYINKNKNDNYDAQSKIYKNFSALENNYINEGENLNFKKIHSKSNSNLDPNQNVFRLNNKEITLAFRHIPPHENLPRKNIYDYHTKERDIHKLNMNIENFFSN